MSGQFASPEDKIRSSEENIENIQQALRHIKQIYTRIWSKYTSDDIRFPGPRRNKQLSQLLLHIGTVVNELSKFINNSNEKEIQVLCNRELFNLIGDFFQEEFRQSTQKGWISDILVSLNSILNLINMEI
ncbi:hypothetical protein D6810_01965 [Candidatus Dojkabacteria bacterium]|uniref:Uncharacterized protein n=1 Tax=Candidatus Dojkabacteria bacterium TaxID=2099670 RepID=A0A3M0YYM0_9BACT|nr:MAG: hypothetical protein D6810_01965 [Candidatus Dojkabacteria bacterium]